jgi:hypothetical protein
MEVKGHTLVAAKYIRACLSLAWNYVPVPRCDLLEYHGFPKEFGYMDIDSGFQKLLIDFPGSFSS